MSQLNMNFPVDANVKLLRQRFATGNIESLHKESRTVGIACIAAGAIGVVFETISFIYLFNHPELIKGRFPGTQMVGTIAFVLLFLYGIRNVIKPTSHRNYNVHYLGLSEAVTRNTGYPQRQYVPAEWEIPLTQYSPEALANILNLVGGWGQDNIFFICNRETHGYRTTNISCAYIFNLCEKGIFLVPIWVDNGAFKAFADLTIFLPHDAIEKMYTVSESFPRKNSIGISIYTKTNFWDPNVRFSTTGGVILNADGKIDGAPFHETNVNKLHELYRNNLKIYLQNQYHN